LRTALSLSLRRENIENPIIVRKMSASRMDMALDIDTKPPGSMTVLIAQRLARSLVMRVFDTKDD
jgi:hypothetical protein